MLTLPFVQRGLVEVLVLALGAGLVGTWIVLRGLAFLSHAVGAAAFPALVLADGLGLAAPPAAFAAALAFTLVLGGLTRREDPYDAATALALVGALALGVILASDVFHSTARVGTLLFGSLLVLSWDDVALAATASASAVVATLWLGSAWLAAGFDPAAARALGLRSRADELALLALVAFVATATLAAVGALLATALLVVPAATARLWTQRLATWRIASVTLAAAQGVTGLWLSLLANAPPGATIAALGGGVFALAALARARLTGARSPARAPGSPLSAPGGARVPR